LKEAGLTPEELGNVLERTRAELQEAFEKRDDAIPRGRPLGNELRNAEQQLRRLDQQISQARRLARNAKDDPALAELSKRREEVQEQVGKLRHERDQHLRQAREEVGKLEKQLREARGRLNQLEGRRSLVIVTPRAPVGSGLQAPANPPPGLGRAGGPGF